MADETKQPGGATPKDVIKRAKEAGVKFVDVRFTDLPGTWQHFSIPVSELTDDLFENGIGFDGSSIRGFQKIFESDMLLFPDPDRCFIDPCLEVKTLAIVCDVKDPLTRAPYSRCLLYTSIRGQCGHRARPDRGRHRPHRSLRDHARLPRCV